MEPTSLPALGVWIEIYCLQHEPQNLRSLPALGVWIEIDNTVKRPNFWPSLPALGVWIEIVMLATSTKKLIVTPSIGSVDWNKF